MSKPTPITKKLVTKINHLLDFGLTSGLGKQEPGGMCVEALVVHALGLPHSDEPPCVASAVRSVKITLNDSEWSSNQARANGMRKLAIAQLGTKDVIDDVEFAKRLAELTIRKMVPRALRIVAALPSVKDHAAKLEAAAVRCEKDGNGDAASDAASYAASAASAASYAASYAASAASYAASAARARDTELTFFADLVLEVLIALKAPGAKWVKYANQKEALCAGE